MSLIGKFFNRSFKPDRFEAIREKGCYNPVLYLAKNC
jgi:hypothetical protein